MICVFFYVVFSNSLKTASEIALVWILSILNLKQLDLARQLILEIEGILFSKISVDSKNHYQKVLRQLLCDS